MARAKQTGFIALKHQERTYKGETYERFTGSFKVGKRTFVFNINAENGQPKIVEGEYKGKDTESVFINWAELDPSATGKGRKRSNEA